MPARPWWRRLRWRDPQVAARRQAAYELYHALVKQARRPVWFAEFGVPDTPEGRFEMVALHAALLNRRLRAEGAAAQPLAQELFDLMVADFDVNLRELGVGDMSVGKYVKRLARNFYARLAALDRALDRGAPAELEPMLRANVYLDAPDPGSRRLAALAGYLGAADTRLAASGIDDLARLDWPAPSRAAGAESGGAQGHSMKR